MYNWRLKDIIMVALIAIVFGFIYLLAMYIGNFFYAALTPLGLAPLAYEFVFGIWIMAGILPVHIIQKPGISVVTEILAALIEMFTGSIFGLAALASCIIQGLSTELIFAIFGYKKYTIPVFMLASVFTATTSFIWECFTSGYFEYSIHILISMLAIRTVSAIIFSGFICYNIGVKLGKSGLAKSYKLGKRL